MSEERTLLAGTAANVIGLGVGIASALGLQILLGRTLVPGGFGLVTVAVQVAFVASAGSRFGMDMAAVRLVAIGRAIGNLSRLAWDDPEFQVRLNETRMQFTNQVTGVLMEAYGEAGQDLVDPELVAALTEALASAAGDPRPWRDG